MRIFALMLIVLVVACNEAPKDPNKELKPTTVQVNENVMSTTGELAIAYYPTEEELKTRFKEKNPDMAAFENWFTSVVEPTMKSKGVQVVKSNQENMKLEITAEERFTMYRPGAAEPFGLFIAKKGSEPLIIQGLISADQLSFKLDSLQKK